MNKPVVSLVFLTIGLFFSSCPSSSQVTQSNYFQFGVSSGDPGLNDVVLWTRISNVPENSDTIAVQCQLSADPTFDVVQWNETVTSIKKKDFTIKVTAENLEPGTHYFYRFKFKEQFSPIGRTKTLPTETDRIRIGIVNCAKFTGGFYNAYEALSEFENIDVVLHLGDYIYENGPVDTDNPKDAYYAAYKATGRQHDPKKTVYKLKDYRKRYHQYQKDSMLQKLHAAFPMINIWDDHEIANDNWKNGAVAHNDKDHGDFDDREEIAKKVYFESLPIAGKAKDPIYRSFQFGKLLNLLMLDARSCCKDKPHKSEKKFEEDPDKRIVGKKQLEWILGELGKDEFTWNLFGNQTLFVNKNPDKINLESWQGYPKDRDKVVEYIQLENKNVVITTGNAHSAHHYVMLDESTGETILHELQPGSVSSGNKDEKVPDQEEFDALVKKFDSWPHLLWYNLVDHGFIILDITQEQVIAEWYFVSTKFSTDYTLRKAHSIVINSKR